MRRWLWRRRERDLVEEMQTHLALSEQEFRRRGLSSAAARDAATRALGGELKTRQAWRDARRGPALTALAADIGAACRGLWRDRAFALLAIVVLGLGIGVNTMQFTVMYTHTLKNLPIPDAARVLHATLFDARDTDRGLSYAEYQDVRAAATLFSDIAAFGGNVPVAIGDEGRAPDRYVATYMTGNALPTLRVTPLVGRTFSEQEERPGAPCVVLVGVTLWRDRYGATPDLHGRDILVDGEPCRVTGIVADASGFPSTAQVWLPAARANGFTLTRTASRPFRVIGRVRSETSVAEATAQLESVTSNALAAGGDLGTGLRASVLPISRRFRARPDQAAWLAFLTVGFVMLALSSANVANLMLARGARRVRELALRGSLGATRGRLLLQLLTESIVLAGLGGLLGLAVAFAGVQLFQSAIPADAMPYWFRYSLDGTILAVLVSVAFGAVLIFGVVPSLLASRTNAGHVLKDGGWTTSGRRPARRWVTTFMAVEIALATLLLCYVALGLAATNLEPPSDRAVNTPDVLTAALSLPADRYPTPLARANFLTELRARVDALPGIAAATTASVLPRQGATEERLLVDRNTTVSGAELPPVWTVGIGDHFFATWGLPLERGRELSARDRGDASHPVVVNRRFVDMFLADRDPIGRQITLRASDDVSAAQPPSLTIVGVAQDLRHRAGIVVDPIVYRPIASQGPATAFLVARTSIGFDRATEQVRGAALALDPHLPLYRLFTMDRILTEGEWPTRVSARLITSLALLALLVTAVGLYAVLAQAVLQQTKEIGVRIAVGAGPRAVGWLILRRAGLQVCLGLFLGLLCVLAWERMFNTGGPDLSFGRLRFSDPRVWLPVLAVVTGIAAVSSLLPLRRAVRLNPVRVLRTD